LWRRIKVVLVLIGASLALTIYLLGYYSARKDHLLVRRQYVTYEKGVAREKYVITCGNFGPGRGGILVSPNEIAFCYIVFTPLRLLEGKLRAMRMMDKAFQAVDRLKPPPRSRCRLQPGATDETHN